MAILVDELVGEVISAALEDKFPSMKDTTPESEAIENPPKAMAGVGAGGALTIAMREVIRRSRGASGGDDVAKNIVGKVAVELGVEDKVDDLLELSKRAMASEEAADILDNMVASKMNPQDMLEAKNSPKGKDIRAMQEFILEQDAAEMKAAKKAAGQKGRRLRETSSRLAREADLEPDLPPPAKTGGVFARTQDAIDELQTSSGGALDADTGMRGQTLGAGKSARAGVDGIVDAELAKPKVGKGPKAIGFDRGREGIADAIDEFSKNQKFKKISEKTGEGMFGKEFIKKIPKKYKWIAGIAGTLGLAKVATDYFGDGEQPQALEEPRPRDTESMLAASEDSLNIATGTTREERDRKNLERRQALEIMNKELAKEFGSK